MLVDTDVLLVDLRYLRDPKHAVNRQAIDVIRARGIQLAITSQVLMEVVGIMSFNLPPTQIAS